MTLKERINALVSLGKTIDIDQNVWRFAIEEACAQNPWFTPASINLSLQGIKHFLHEDDLQRWAELYAIPSSNISKRCGLIMAGNIPCVGFHDLLCVFLTGNHAVIKLSSKDSVLPQFIVQTICAIDPRCNEYFNVVERLNDIDAIIATGSNNSSRYFEMYFAKYPHIIRKNRNGIAVLYGDERDEDIRALGLDIFAYFGLGCRNVSKIYIPENYNFDQLMAILHEFNDVVNHNKYKNNFDYNIALFMLNKAQYMNNGAFMLVKEKSLASRIASVNYEYFESIESLTRELTSLSEQIQCVVSTRELEGIKTIRPGTSQSPTFIDYADGIDTMQFLQTI